MALDMAKYLNLFLEEATDHLAEFSRGLLELEKDAADAESIDLVFRMAHSIKSMAASLGFDSISEVSHHLESRLQSAREAGAVAGGEELRLLFGALEALEEMVGHVREHGEPPAAPDELLAALKSPPTTAGASLEAATAGPAAETAKKKALS